MALASSRARIRRGTTLTLNSAEYNQTLECLHRISPGYTTNLDNTTAAIIYEGGAPIPDDHVARVMQCMTLSRKVIALDNANPAVARGVGHNARRGGHSGVPLSTRSLMDPVMTVVPGCLFAYWKPLNP